MLSDLDDDVLRGFLMSHRDRGVSVQTANRDCEQMLAMWRYAAKRRIVDVFPTVQSLNEPRRIPDAWSEQQVHDLFAAAGKATGKVCGLDAAIWWTAIFTAVWWSGKTIGAIMRLRCQDIDKKSSAKTCAV